MEEQERLFKKNCARYGSEIGVFICFSEDDTQITKLREDKKSW